MLEKKEKDREKINIRNLNRCINEYKKLGYLLNNLVIIIMICLAIYILGKCHVFPFIFEFITILIPLFIGVLVAWLFSPLIDKLTKKKVPRILSCIIVYVIMLSLVLVILGLVIPNFVSQIKDLIAAMPNILDELKEVINDLFKNNESAAIEDVKKNIFKTIGPL